ncbi:hypothetical protein A3E49_01350 [Candidatus Saccharibacteria bacterium RIFCSPHIGHO2_12_FULL_49_19]|nr:MAG: hypothetical protein A3E49_01350 [Candidatus Saccharibacteria bacterium RIFCSPHIGHO2_12_FULL_49_19]
MSMFLSILKLTLALSLVLVLFNFLTPAVDAQFDPLEDPCTAAPDSPTCRQKEEQRTSGTNPIAGPDGIIQTAANLIALVAGIIAVITIIISGFIFVTAGGAIGGQRAGDNPTRAREARTVLTGAIIGLVVVALAWSIVSFVNDRIL